MRAAASRRRACASGCWRRASCSERRFAGSGLHANAQMGPKQIAAWCRLDPASSDHLGRIVQKRGISARGVHRILRVARTIADLEGEAIDRTRTPSMRDRLSRARPGATMTERIEVGQMGECFAAHRHAVGVGGGAVAAAVDVDRRGAPAASRRQLYAASPPSRRCRRAAIGTRCAAGATARWRTARSSSRSTTRSDAAPSTPGRTTTCSGWRHSVARLREDERQRLRRELNQLAIV